jgi:hypothetical protein
LQDLSTHTPFPTHSKTLVAQHVRIAALSFVDTVVAKDKRETISELLNISDALHAAGLTNSSSPPISPCTNPNPPKATNKRFAYYCPGHEWRWVGDVLVGDGVEEDLLADFAWEGKEGGRWWWWRSRGRSLVG